MGQSLISFLHRFKWDFVCSCFRRQVQDSVLDSLEGKREGCVLNRSTRRQPVLPSPTPPRRPAVRRPDTTGPCCPGLGFDKLFPLGCKQYVGVSCCRSLLFLHATETGASPATPAFSFWASWVLKNNLHAFCELSSTCPA